MSTLFGMLGGSKNKTDRKEQLGAWGDLNKLGDWATGFGEKQATAGANSLDEAMKFYDSILSGDRAKIGQVLSPEISTIQGQENQAIQTQEQFGNRSGGTNAGVQASETAGQTQIQSLINSLLGQSAAGAASTGAAAEGLGLSAVGQGASAYSTVGGQAGQDRVLAYQEQQDKGKAEAELLNALLMGLGV